MSLINPQDEPHQNVPLVPSPREPDSEDFEPGGARTCCCFIDIYTGIKIIGATWIIEVILLFVQITSVTNDGG